MFLDMAFVKTQRDPSIHDEGGKETRGMFEFMEGTEDSLEQVIRVGRTQVGEFAVLGPTPDPLIGVVLGIMAEEVFTNHVRLAGEAGLDDLGLAVDVAA